MRHILIYKYPFRL